jgi:Cellulase (glycosyl hydrolase family 5)
VSTANIKGLTFSGLQGDAYGGSTYKSAATVMAEIDAAKNNFGCTAVRLQIQQQLLVGQDGSQYDSRYKATVDSVVQHALDAGLIVIINCQTLNNASRSGVYYPNQSNSATNAFWEHERRVEWERQRHLRRLQRAGL